MSPRLIAVWVFAVVVSITSSASALSQETGFLNRSLTIGDVVYRYQVYLPQDWTGDKAWPVILFLHGAGERGRDGLRQTQVGLGAAIRLEEERFPFVVVMPQCPKEKWWTDPEMQREALSALDAAMKEFHGDPSRLYLTGLSMGGYGTWYIAASNPGKFAALVTICGGVVPPSGHPQPIALGPDPYADLAKKIGSTPVWIFHGSSDPVVLPSESRNMAYALRKTGGNVRLTEYWGVGHDSWDKAYAESELPQWLLSHTLTKE